MMIARVASSPARSQEVAADWGAERAYEIVRETWRAFEEFNLSPPLALEALFVRLRRELGSATALV